MTTTTWSQAHVHTATGTAKVRTNGRVDVAPASLYDQGAEGWVFRFRGQFATETHRGYRTMREAMAAGLAYVTSPVGR